MHIPEGRQWIEIMTDKLIRVLGSLRRRSKWCLSVEMPEKRSLQVQGAFPLITGPVFSPNFGTTATRPVAYFPDSWATSNWTESIYTILSRNP